MVVRAPVLHGLLDGFPVCKIPFQNAPREVYDLISRKETIGYTTVLKFMQIMTEKGLLERDASVRPQIFSAAQPQQQTQKMMLRDLVDRAFAGSPGNLALQALSTKKSTPQELREIRALLDKLERESA